MKKTLFTKLVKLTIAAAAMCVISTSAVFASSIDELIQNGLDSRETTIDVSSAEEAPQQAIDDFHMFLSSHPSYYFVDTNVNCNYSGEKATSLVVTYTDDSSSGSYDDIINGIASSASAYSSEYEKVKYVYSYLAENYTYDYTYSNFTAKDLIVGGSAVCEGFSCAFKDIMDKLGIDCSYVKSTDMQHMWNVVKVDGKWYNVDVTYENTTKIAGQAADEGYLLKSDFYMSIIGYYGGVTTNGVSCSDTTYDMNI